MVYQKSALRDALSAPTTAVSKATGSKKSINMRQVPVAVQNHEHRVVDHFMVKWIKLLRIYPVRLIATLHGSQSFIPGECLISSGRRKPITVQRVLPRFPNSELGFHII